MLKQTLIAILLSLPILAYSQQALPIGSKAPNFTALSNKSKSIMLSDLLKEKKVVLLFYRGQWCPYCNKELSNIQDSLKLITNLDAVVVAITPEKPEEISKTIDKTGASFTIIWDESHRIMDLYHVTFQLSKTKQIAYKAWGIDINHASGNNDYALPVPATYIINNDGKIAGSFFDENYKKRMSVKEIISTLKIIQN